MSIVSLIHCNWRTVKYVDNLIQIIDTDSYKYGYHNNGLFTCGKHVTMNIHGFFFHTGCFVRGKMVYSMGYSDEIYWQ